MIDIRDIGIIKQRHHIKDDGLGHVATWGFTSRHILKQFNESHLFSPINFKDALPVPSFQQNSASVFQK
jgi:hypothetical protein